MTRGRFLLLLVLGFFLGLGLLLLLPHDRYHRFQEYRLAETRTADWIYERLHFDETPIDIALIGTSRMAGGVSAPELAKAYCALTGRRVRVANLAIPQFGRGMDFVVAQELFRTKAPELVVMQITEVEGRRPHPGFQTLADARDILAAPVLINLGWAEDLAALPGRQLSLFLKTALGRPAVTREFDPRRYAGPDVDRTRSIPRIAGGVIDRTGTMERDRLERVAAARRAGFTRTYLLPEPLRHLEYRVSQRYLDRVHEMARQAGADVAYAYMPGYGFDGAVPEHVAALAAGFEIWRVHDAVLGDHRMWLDGNHTNHAGAQVATQALARRIAQSHPGLGKSPASACDASGLRSEGSSVRGHGFGP
jgi:hypothetical protein